MATLSVWKFDTPGGASGAELVLHQLSKEELITIHDAAVVEWYPGKKKPKTRQLSDVTGTGAYGGAFFGFLFGLIFFVPLLGLAVGAGIGALSGSLVDAGIDDDFIQTVREKVTPGTSALFVLSSGAVIDKVRDAFVETKAELVHTNLSGDEEAKLREAFAVEG